MTQASFKPIVEPRRPDTTQFRGLEQLAWLMDRAIKIPGTNITVGLDALLGLLPIGGDVMTGLIQTAIVLVAMFQYRVPRAVASPDGGQCLARHRASGRSRSWAMPSTCSSRPTRNIKLLQQVQAQRTQHREVATWPSIAYLAFIAFALITMLALLLIGFLTVVAWLFHRPVV